MKNIYIKFSFLFLIFLFSCSEEKVDGVDFGSVTGRVVRENTFEPVANAKVFSNPNSSTVFTDNDGRFTMPSVATGNYSFQSQKDGYITKFEAVVVNSGSNTEVVFEMKLSTSNNRPPDTPVLVSPADNAINQNMQVILTWTAEDIDLDSLTYEVTLRNDINDDIVIYSDIETKTFTLNSLAFGTKYFWQVSSNDGINPPVLSTVRTFTTTSFPLTRFLFVKKLSEKNVIYAGDASGNQVQLTASDANSWRPRRNTQSNKIAFIRSNGSQNHIYTMNPDGSAVFKVTNSVPIAGFNSEYLNFSWNNSGNEIIYANFDKLYKINANGSGLVQIFQTPDGKFISECDWSYDNSKIALKVNSANGYNAEIYVIGMNGVIQDQVISGVPGAIGGLNFSVTGTKLIFTRDISGFENQDYRQLDSRVFEHNFSTNITTQINTEKPAGTVDLDVRYSPSEAELIFVNTSNDFMSVRNIQKYVVGTTTSRVTLFTNGTMPDWE
ncbi:carboxypeptidase regulatory-like domain-containing protein [Flavobacterium macacae]|uniref:Fibronectin type-III domain-containing protein n=1 Tax=Flavobacterium macacae TaxID=2488993 RepID=A0A3P3WF58_9FLAO|nr:carboxypeptidase regulatory-like domain-containing protein [Flavobacterium macacae]RRJ93017.1 hypothetical protein EG849_05360 [Flavobacterium macacae]